MDERKILFFGFTAMVYCAYCALMWYARAPDAEVDIPTPSPPEPTPEIIREIIQNKTEAAIPVLIKKKKHAPVVLKDACSILEVFTTKPQTKCVNCHQSRNVDANANNNALAVFGIMVFLTVLVINAILDVLKVKEEELIRKKHNPDGDRRHSLAEFANKKTLRRESSKFSLNLFQIPEGSKKDEEEKKPKRHPRPYMRGESTNSYLTEKNLQKEAASTPRTCETPTGDPKLGLRPSGAKIFGVRPSPLVRRSSFPALPLNPDVQALMLGHRRPSTADSDDEDRGRRVRIIRRY